MKHTTIIIIIIIINIIVSVFSPDLTGGSPGLFFRTLETMPRAPTTIYINIIFVLYSLFSSSARSRYLFIFSFLLLSLYGLLERKNQPDDNFFLFHWLTLSLIF